MDEKDRVFARFKDERQAVSKRREILTIPHRSRSLGSKVVEVVRVRSSGTVGEKARRADTQVRAASWDEGFPAKQATLAPAPFGTATSEVSQPVGHVMPAWEPAEQVTGPAQSAAADDAVIAVRRSRGRPRKEIPVTPSRRVADPFDDADEGANCVRCGYAVEPGREKKGMMTCAACG